MQSELTSNRILMVLVHMFLFTTKAWGLAGPLKKEPLKKFGISAGYFISNVGTSVRLGAGIGIDLDVENLFGMDATTSDINLKNE